MNKMARNSLWAVSALSCMLISACSAAGKVIADEKTQAGIHESVQVKPITGSWINLAYKDVRNKYTNPKGFDNTDPELWSAKVRELSRMGMEYLVLMETANDGQAFYPSELMPGIYPEHRKSPVDAVLDEAAKHGMKVFLSCGWAKDQDDNLLDPAIKERQLQIMEELAALYKGHPAFYGWYLPVEDCLGPVLPENAVRSVNSLTEKARALTPGKKTMISPYGIGLVDFDNPEFEKRMLKLNVDIIAYQDGGGCVREPYILPNWKKMRRIHDKMNAEMWANCETFTWEDGINDRQSALIPAAYSRLLEQQVAASRGGVDRIISFMFVGIIENPASAYQLGQAVWSGKTYEDYMAWRNGDSSWKMQEAAYRKNLINAARPEMIENAHLKALADGQVAEMSAGDDHWVIFEKGRHEVVLDFARPVLLNQVMVRTLNYHKDNICPPLKLYLYVSEDGVRYQLASIKDAPYFANDRHDAWIDATFFNEINKNVRYVKLSFDVPAHVFMDEIFVNPEERAGN